MDLNYTEIFSNPQFLQNLYEAARMSAKENHCAGFLCYTDKQFLGCNINEPSFCNGHDAGHTTPGYGFRGDMDSQALVYVQFKPSGMIPTVADLTRARYRSKQNREQASLWDMCAYVNPLHVYGDSSRQDKIDLFLLIEGEDFNGLGSVLAESGYIADTISIENGKVCELDGLCKFDEAQFLHKMMALKDDSFSFKEAAALSSLLSGYLGKSFYSGV